MCATVCLLPKPHGTVLEKGERYVKSSYDACENRRVERIDYVISAKESSETI